MQKMIVYLHSDDLSHFSWFLLDETGILQKKHVNSTLSALAIDAQDKQLILIAPPPSILLTEVNLPKLNKQRLLQALPFALEEKLLTNINELHFAVGNYQEDSTSYPVALIEKNKLKTWLDEFKAVNLVPSSVIPAPLSLPLRNDDWYIQIVDNTAIARTGLYDGFACDKENLSTMLRLKADESKNANEITLFNVDGPAFLADELGIKDLVTEKKLSEKQFFTEIFSELEHPKINLLQNEFQPRRKTTENKKIWRWVTYATLAWLSLILLSNIVSLGILHYKNATLETAINQIYKKNFPTATAIIAPKQRMQEKLSSLTNQSNKNQALILLAYVGKYLPHTSLNIQQMTYQNHQLRLDFLSSDFVTVDNISKNLMQQGLSVKQENVTALANQVKGTLLISTGNNV